MDSPQHPRLRDGLELRLLPDGVALLDLDTEAVHVLNPSAAFILEGLDGTRDRSSLALELAEAVPGLDPAQAALDVDECLTTLTQLGLLAT